MGSEKVLQERRRLIDFSVRDDKYDVLVSLKHLKCGQRGEKRGWGIRVLFLSPSKVFLTCGFCGE